MGPLVSIKHALIMSLMDTIEHSLMDIRESPSSIL